MRRTYLRPPFMLACSRYDHVNQLKFLYSEYPRQYWLIIPGIVLSTARGSMIWPLLLIYANGKLPLPFSTVATLEWRFGSWIVQHSWSIRPWSCVYFSSQSYYSALIGLQLSFGTKR